MKKIVRILISATAFLMIFVLHISVKSMPLTNEVIEELRTEGQLENVVRQHSDAQRRGLDLPNPHPFRFNPDVDEVDTLRGIVILVDFDDLPKEWNYDSEPEDFIELLFSLGQHPTGSMRDYYWETSYQQAMVIGDVAGWYRMPEDYSYYVDGQRGFGSYPNNAQRLAEDAVMAADPDVNFSLYDNNLDGVVDALFIVHSGPGYEDTGNPNYIHSHAWVMSYYIELDSVYCYGYSMEPEETGQGSLVHMGVFGHEFGHVLGLPDLYDYDYSSDGLGGWSMMAGGCWGNGGRTPVHFDAWCKSRMGWVNPALLTQNIHDAEVPAVELNSVAYRLWRYGQGGPQYFLVENRRQILFDSYLPGEGILIYHVDETVPNNNNEEHYKVALEQADGRRDLEGGRGADGGDPYPGMTDNRTFDDFSDPNALDYFDNTTEVAVWNISDSDSLMTANLDVIYDRPLINLETYSFDDASGNNNGRPEGGETVDFYFTISNLRAAADDATVTVSADTSAVNFIDNSSHWTTIPELSTVDNNHDPVTFSLPEGFDITWITFYMHFESNGGEYEIDLEIEFLSGMPQVVLIDDDGGGVIEGYYTSTHIEINLPFDLWDISTQGRIGDELLNYKAAVWFTGNHSEEPSLTEEDITDIVNFLNDGNKSLFMTSQDVVETLTERGNPQDIDFLENYLKAGYAGRAQDHLLEGEDGDLIGDGMLLVTAGSGGAANQVSQDDLTAGNGTSVCFRYTPDQVAGLYHEMSNGSRVVTFGFGFEGINGDVGGYNSRPEVMSQVMLYLLGLTDVPDDAGEFIPRMHTLSQNYPNPFNASTNISFHLARTSNVRLSVYNLLGQNVKTLHSGKLPVGDHDIFWDGSDNAGKQVSSGIYLYRLSGEDFNIVKRMIFLK